MEEWFHSLIAFLIQTHIYQLAQQIPITSTTWEIIKHLITKIQTEKKMDETKHWKACGIKNPSFDKTVYTLSIFLP